MLTSSTFSELDGTFDVTGSTKVFASCHEDDVEDEQRLWCLWLHQVELDSSTVHDWVVVVCVLWAILESTAISDHNETP